MVSEVRAVLAPFDWEHDDRQLALEAIEHIVLADDEEPEPEPEEHDPGPEVEDEGGMIEYRYIIVPEDPYRARGPVMTGDRCAWPGCQVTAKRVHLMCHRDWNRLPKPLRAAIWEHFWLGQTVLTCSPEYRDALRDVLVSARRVDA